MGIESARTHWSAGRSFERPQSAVAGAAQSCVCTEDPGDVRHVMAVSSSRSKQFARASKGMSLASRNASSSAVNDVHDGIHEAMAGGPRGEAPARKDSMSTMWPRPQFGPSRRDTPVRRS
jgi:hypothetical protein